MGDISAEQQRDYTNIMIVIFGGLSVILLLVVLIGYVRWMEKKWREVAAKRSNRRRSRVNIEPQDLPLESSNTFIYFGGLSAARSANLATEPPVVHVEAPNEERWTDPESERTVVRPEGLRERRLTEVELGSSHNHGEGLRGEVLTGLESEPTRVHPRD